MPSSPETRAGKQLDRPRRRVLHLLRVAIWPRQLLRRQTTRALCQRGADEKEVEKSRFRRRRRRGQRRLQTVMRMENERP